MSVPGRDNAQVGYTFHHPKADSKPGYQPRTRSVAGTLFTAALAGAIIGFALGAMLAPSFGPALALGMAMTFVGLRTALYVGSRRRASAQKDQEQKDRRDTFESQYAQAKANGDFDRWKDKT